MSLDNIQIPPIVLQNLYGKSLIDLKTGGENTASWQRDTLSYLGNNQKRIAVVVNSPDTIYLPDDELNFLLGILSACKFSMEDTALINISKNPLMSYNKVAEQLRSEKIFLFGVDPEKLGLPLQFPHYQIQHFNNQLYLSSVSLTVLQNNKEEKLKLWNCLKKIFLTA
jgi:hypothetical protein